MIILYVVFYMTVNRLMLWCMYEGEYLLSEENYRDYLEKERIFYTIFDYESSNGQEDYKCGEDTALLLD